MCSESNARSPFPWYPVQDVDESALPSAILHAGHFAGLPPLSERKSTDIAFTSFFTLRY